MMANWFHETSMPRTSEGATSPMYMGQMADARPTPTPPMTRYMLKAMSSWKQGLPCSKKRNSGVIEPRAEMKKSNPATMSERLRPRFEANRPLRAEPMIQPIRAEAEVKPCRASV